MTSEELKVWDFAATDWVENFGDIEQEKIVAKLVTDLRDAIRQLAKEVKCGFCGGDGEVTEIRFPMVNSVDCPRCHGTGLKYNLEG